MQRLERAQEAERAVGGRMAGLGEDVQQAGPAQPAAGVVAVKIGDLKKVRNVLSEVKEGANAALTLDEGFTLKANRTLASRHPTEIGL